MQERRCRLAVTRPFLVYLSYMIIYDQVLIADAKMAKDIHKIQANVESFTNYVIGALVGIKGRNKSDVTAFIVKNWIDDHSEELKAFGIGPKEWRSSQRKAEQKRSKSIDR